MWPIGSLVTCTRTLWPEDSTDSILRGWPSLWPSARPVDLTGVEHGVAALADVDEGGLHRGQDVLDAAEVDVADQRGLRLAGDVVLDEHVVLEHGDLGDVVVLPDHHHPVDRLAPGQELGLADDRRTTAPGLAALAAALLLGLEPGRAGHGGDLVVGAAAAPDPGDGVGRVVPAVTVVVTGSAAAAPTAGGGAARPRRSAGHRLGRRALVGIRRRTRRPSLARLRRPSSPPSRTCGVGGRRGGDGDGQRALALVVALGRVVAAGRRSGSVSVGTDSASAAGFDVRRSCGYDAWSGLGRLEQRRGDGAAGVLLAGVCVAGPRAAVGAAGPRPSCVVFFAARLRARPSSRRASSAAPSASAAGVGPLAGLGGGGGLLGGASCAGGLLRRLPACRRSRRSPGRRQRTPVSAASSGVGRRRGGLLGGRGLPRRRACASSRAARRAPPAVVSEVAGLSALSSSMSLLGPDAACCPGRVRRRRPEQTGPTTQSLRWRRHPPQVRHSRPEPPTAVAGPAGRVCCHQLSRAASRSGDDLDSACRARQVGTGENVVGSSAAAHRTTDHVEYRTREHPIPALSTG